MQDVIAYFDLRQNQYCMQSYLCKSVTTTACQLTLRHFEYYMFQLLHHYTAL